MDDANILEAARLLARARKTGEPLLRLPEACRPRDAAEAYAIELALLEESAETLAGWKVALSSDHGLMMGLLVASRVHPTGAALDTGLFSMRGVEIEIAFRFDRAFPPRAAEYRRDEIERGVTALPGVEIVDTRFSSYDDTPALERMADFMSNGAFIVGAARSDWRDFDLTQLEAYVAFDGRDQARRTGGHPSRDPLLPAVALINRLRQSSGVGEGLIVTTGSYAGMCAAPGLCDIEAGFSRFGAVKCRLTQ
jgi:2-keto-4-pentenoate hydratase